MNTVLPIQIEKGNGTPVVLLHGLGNNFKSWTYVLEQLDESQNKIIAVDLLGFGDASKPKDCEYTASDHAEAVINTLDSLNLTGAMIVGHSMGCIVAAEVARLRPDLVTRLLLLGAPLFKHQPNRFDRLKFWVKEDAYSKIFKILSTQKDLTLAAANGVVKFLPLIKGMEVTEETWQPFRKSLMNTIVQTQTYRFLRTIQIPTRVVYGHLDLFVIKRNLKSVARHNKKFVSYDTMLGPHEITPIHGKAIAELIQPAQK